MGNNSNAIRKETQETIIDRFGKGQIVADFVHCQEQRVCCKPSVAVGNLWRRRRKRRIMDRDDDNDENNV